MYWGCVKGVGPSYCPSIEDKIVRFNDKASSSIIFRARKYLLSMKYIFKGFQEVYHSMFKTNDLVYSWFRKCPDNNMRTLLSMMRLCLGKLCHH